MPLATPVCSRAVLAAAALCLTLTACAATAPGSATTAPPGQSVPERLLVVDPAASALHVFSVPEHELVVTLDGIAMNDHAGLLPVADGRVLLADAESDSVLAIDVATAEPAVVAEAALPGDAVHLAVDPGRTTVAVSTTSPDGNAISLFDLDSLDPVSTVSVASAEPGLVLGDDYLVHRDGAEDGTLELISTGGAPAGTQAESDVEDTTPVGAWGHGEALVDNRVYVATDAGLEWAEVAEGGFEAPGSATW